MAGAAGPPALRRRVRVRVEGIVQGVGFRPFVHRLASELGLAGFVGNDERGVFAEAEGGPADVAAFLAALGERPPPLAVVERVTSSELVPTGAGGAFAIAPSTAGAEPRALVSPDSATCGDCLRELFDPTDRRFRYPFVNCTNCGPRFTIVRDVPYDRPRTTMAGFAMCAACRAEFDDPGDRRFHAQPNACPDCGPRARLLDAAGGAAPEAAPDAVAAAAAALATGAVVAVKGIGGYHLACRARDGDVVAALRARKRREDRPFALLVGDEAAARTLVALGPEEAALLAARERPIVLAPRLDDAPVASAVAPGAPELGVMLPYAPLHHVLCADVGEPLVLTSGNVSDEPIAYRDADALERLGAIADRFLVHDRPIHMRTDDSVARVVATGPPLVAAAPSRRPLLLRRSRGYVPAGLPLAMDGGPPLLACGAELKAAFCVAKEGRAWVSHHIGDLEGYETRRSYTEGIEHFERLFAVAPAVVAHDLHPDYASTRYALERADGDDRLALVAVQHHHAHLAACLAEHGERGPAVGAIFDGTGLGPDGTIWGGELLVGGLDAYTRAGHLWPVRLPGGDRAAREPWRMACAWLQEAHGGEAPATPAALAGRVAPERWEAVAGLARGGLAAPVTTSAGRLFDAVAALCGLRAEVTYEGQAAVELEAACDPAERGAYAIAVTGDPLVLDPRAAVLTAAADVAAGVPVPAVATRFHAGLAAATAAACARVAARHGLDVVVLSGGVFQNRRLLEATAATLAADGLRVLIPERLPANDGGIAYGQAAVAAASATDHPPNERSAP